ncbi:hypothetical protein ACLQ29_26600 [Micromonospora sp. DT228]|uniref:hypothetical protein n=1 Tax=Micromonospora sp. DT228 TaxID=3393443 RepID=UPI003CEBCBAA
MIAPPLASRSWKLRAAVAAAVVLASCLAIPVGWAAVKTAGAGRGEATPVAAADAYLLAAFAEYGDGLGVERCLCDSRRDALLEETNKMREQLAATGKSIKVESSDWREVDADGTVSVQIHLRFTDVAASGGPIFIVGKSHEWRFKTKHERGLDSGWKVCRIDAPPLCGTHIRC